MFRIASDENGAFEVGRNKQDIQFAGFVEANFPEYTGMAEEYPDFKLWYATLHIFDPKGKHLKSHILLEGSSADGERGVIAKAKIDLQAMIDEALGEVKREDIKIEPFKMEYEGRTFGIMQVRNRDEYQLMPGGMVFRGDGTYSSCNA
ncbi:MAG: hypothetical protein ABFD98_00030 [Syntrophobacteraceae bacterium]|nr:hypothetical protein [Desulfobacteraceae bacterium]